tara:strand:+ start:956 stop:1108 length:153 start_codon:yes stop_codon:yes gene_type:complete
MRRKCASCSKLREIFFTWDKTDGIFCLRYKLEFCRDCGEKIEHYLEVEND